jgi:hypothetical protein
MSMSPEAQREYDDALRKITLQHGTPLRVNPSFYVQNDYRLVGHAATCGIVTASKPKEDVWHEFAGTFASTDAGKRHGIVVTDVSCNCGQLVQRTIRWEASISEISEALFGEIFEVLIDLRTKMEDK